MAVALRYVFAAIAFSIMTSCAASGSVPQYVTIAFAGTSGDGMAVSWKTDDKTPSLVKYGLSPDHLSQTANGTIETYGEKYGWQHHTVLKGLKPNTKYYYQAGSEGSFSETASFTTARAAGDGSEPFDIVVVGDMGIDHSKNTINLMKQNLDNVDWFLHIGDLSYADDWFLRGDTYEGTWDTWLAEMAPITSTKAYMTLPGNHEATCNEVLPFLCEDHQKNFTEYRYRFRMPSEESGGYNNMWYSFDYGLVHFVNVDSETSYPDAPEGRGSYIDAGPFGDQLGWLKNDLAKAAQNRHNVPWIVVSGHRPLYSRHGAVASQVKNFEPLFHQYGVDLYFAGHVHWYERNYPTYNNVPTQKNYTDPTAPIYIVSGAGGNVEGLNDYAAPKPWSAFLNYKDYGYGILTTHNETALTWKFYNAANNTIIDSIDITKKPVSPE